MLVGSLLLHLVCRCKAWYTAFKFKQPVLPFSVVVLIGTQDCQQIVTLLLYPIQTHHPFWLPPLNRIKKQPLNFIFSNGRLPILCMDLISISDSKREFLRCWTRGWIKKKKKKRYRMWYVNLAGGHLFYFMTNLEVLFNSGINTEDLLNAKAKLNAASGDLF